MQSFKNKLYNYEAPPPEEIWQHIDEELQNEKVSKNSRLQKIKKILLPGGRSSFLGYYFYRIILF